MLYTIGGVFLLLLAMVPKTAWSGEKEIFYERNLVFVQKTRSLVGMSASYQREVKKRGRDSLVRIQTIPIWSAENGRLEDTLYFSPKGGPKGIDGNPNGDGVVAALWNPPAKGEKYGHSSIAYYSLTEKNWVWTDDWPSEFDMARGVKFSSDGLKVIGVGFKNILIYDTKTGKKLESIGEPLKDYPLLSMSVRGSVLSPSGRYFVVWQEPAPPGHHVLGRLIANKWVAVWDLKNRKQIARWRKPEYQNYCAAFTRDEKYILFGSGKEHIRTWSIEKQDIIRDWSLGDLGVVNDMKFSEDYRYLAVHIAGEKFQIRVYDYSNEKESHSFEGMDAPAVGDPYPMTFFDRNDFFAFVKKKQVCVYDTQMWREKWCVPTTTEGLTEGLKKD